MQMRSAAGRPFLLLSRSKGTVRCQLHGSKNQQNHHNIMTYANEIIKLMNDLLMSKYYLVNILILI